MKVIPLGFLETGETAVVKDIAGGRGFRTKLEEMGFSLGSKVLSIKNDGFGPLIVSVMDCRIALGRGMAQKLLVEIKNN
jgi:ferrous iron transport protein A